MFKDKLNKLKIKVQEDGEGNSKKKIENMVFFVIILIITIIVINAIWNDGQMVNNKQTNTINNGKQLAKQQIEEIRTK